MKTFLKMGFAALFIFYMGCNKPGDTPNAQAIGEQEVELKGQSGVIDETSKPNIVQTAIASKDHSTLVTAVKAAGLVDALSNAGPFTVFAPTNDAFNKLPKGTLDELLKPEKKGDLENILGYHTYVGVLKTDYLQNGQQFDMVYGGKVMISRDGDKVLVNGSEVLASIETSNGIIHVIGDVLLPK